MQLYENYRGAEQFQLPRSGRLQLPKSLFLAQPSLAKALRLARWPPARAERAVVSHWGITAQT
jgi:hypothetical protein